jgi:hypothetical protein
MQELRTVATAVPTGDDDGMKRLRQLADRDDELNAHARIGFVLHSTHTIVGGDRVTFVDTFTRTTSTPSD